MQKTIVKTALITLLSLILIAVGAFGVTALFFPSALGDFFGKLGNYDASVRYYEKAYLKSDNTGDLYNLVVKLSDTDGTKIEKYCSELLAKSDFADFCRTRDEKEPSSVNTKQFVSGKYAVSLYRNGKLSTAIEFGNDYCNKEGKYEVYNPLYFLVAESRNMNQTDVNLLRNDLLSIKSGFTDVSVIDADINVLTQLLTKGE